MISAFGARARLYAAGLGDLEAVVADSDSLAAAYIEAVRRRELGQSFYGMVLHEEKRAQVILAIAPSVLQQITDFDTRREALERLGDGRLTVDGRPVEELWAAGPEAGPMAREFLSLATAALVRSFAEAERLAALSPRLRSFEPVLVEPAVPQIAPRLGTRPGVLVWAPNFPAANVAWYVLALAEFFGDVICVTSGGTVPTNVSARFVGPLDPELPEILASVQCVLCADPDDPGAAVAFARLGFGIVAPRSSGAHEFVRDIVTFDLRTQKDVEVAVNTAIAQPASVRWTPQPPRTPTVPVLPGGPSDLPLVSVAVLTYNRPDDLDRCLTALQRQTYPHIEAVVLNDAGENVDHIVARYPFARPVNLPVNGGVLGLIAEGINHFRGAYVQFLADDDTLYPDHIERLMNAMLRSGAAVAHGNTLIRYQDRRQDGTLQVSGFNALVFSDTVTATGALISTPISGQSLICRRDIYDEIGYWRQDTPLADQEFQMRAANRYVFAYVDQFTAEWRVRGKEGLSSNTDGGAAMRYLFEVIQPVVGRPGVDEARRRALEGFAQRPAGFVFQPTFPIDDTTASAVKAGPS